MAFTVWTWTKQEDGTSKNVPSVQGEGMTVGSGSTYLYDGDSSYWAVVAVPGGEETDGEGWTFKKVGSGYSPHADLVIDAPEEIMEAYRAAQAASAAALLEAQIKAQAERAAQEAAWEAQTPRKGKTVRVVRGRKVPLGTEGECFYYGEGQWGWRVGFKAPGSDEPIWTAASNVEVVQPALQPA